MLSSYKSYFLGERERERESLMPYALDVILSYMYLKIPIHVVLILLMMNSYV